MNMSCQGCKLGAFDQRSHMQDEFNENGCLKELSVQLREKTKSFTLADLLSGKCFDKNEMEELFKAVRAEEEARPQGPPIPFAERLRSCGCTDKIAGMKGPDQRCGRFGNRLYYEHVNDE